MGDHLHKEGEWMLSYRFMTMGMEGSQIGTSDVSPQAIATGVANPFFGLPGQPPTLRVVPTQMTMDMHMFGAMYAPTDDLTLMAMANYVEKDMDHLTFQGGMGTNILGGFTTRTSGFGDTKIAVLKRLFQDDTHNFHLNMGISLPTGSITETGAILTPMGGTPTVRLPYAMQLGTGTYDLLPGITYTGFSDDYSWGAQYRGEIRLGKNDEGYAWGHKHAVTAWFARQWQPWVSTSLRLDAITQDSIDGFDDQISGPVQTANPENFGGDRIDMYLGLNLLGQEGDLKGYRLAAELGFPIYQDLNGPQLETDYTLTIGLQKAF